MRINYNVSAMLSNNALAQNDSLLSQSLQRLSSGLKINSAKDNPAGLAMSKRMNAQIEGLYQASQNASNGVSIIETADGALSEIQSMIQRMNELAVQGNTSVKGDEDRRIIQNEIAQLKEEVQRVADSTEFNSQKLLDGEFDFKSYTSEIDIKINTVSDEVSLKTYTIDRFSIGQDANGSTNIVLDFGHNFPNDAQVTSFKEGLLTIKASGGFEMVIDTTNMAEGQVYSDVKVDVTGIGAMRLQIGSNEGQVLPVRIPRVSLQDLGIENMDVSTMAGANDAVERLKNANMHISQVRSRLGAYQNRLESSINSIDITSENMTAAYSRIMDVDMAEEMTRYTTYQVLTQAGTSMLAQANERPSQVLQLLQ